MQTLSWTPRVGDWVEVRSVAEISATLDAKGELAKLPFMSEMLRFVGGRFRVVAVAHKTCDTVNRTGGRRVDRVVHLEGLRCDGAGHGGCQAACLLFWKLDWLKPADGPHSGPQAKSAASAATDALHATLQANASSVNAAGNVAYRCQATTLPDWTRPLHWWDVRQYWRDVRTGNVPLGHALRILLLASVFNMRKLPIGYRASVWLYRRVHEWVRGFPDPHGRGPIPRGQATPDGRLHLKIGEVVKIRSRDEIYATVNEGNFNRGLQVDEEMTKYCGAEFRVTDRITQIINERTGEMMQFKNPCIVLDGVDCTGDYSAKRLLCPRRIPAYWREIWLERTDPAPSTTAPE